MSNVLENILTNEGLFEIRATVFGHLDYKTRLVCRQVSKSWYQAMEEIYTLKQRVPLVNYLRKFGKKVAGANGPGFGGVTEQKKVRKLCPEWNKIVHKCATNASLAEIQEIKNALVEISGHKHSSEDGWKTTLENNFICAVLDADNAKLLQFVADAKYDLDETKCFPDRLITAFQYACQKGKTNCVRFLIEHSRELKIDLNFTNMMGHTPFLRACGRGGNFETVKLLMESSKEYDIHLNIHTNFGQNAFLWLMKEAPKDHWKIFRLFLENYKEFGIDIKATDMNGSGAIDYADDSIQHFTDLEECHNKSYEERIQTVDVIITMLTDEYSKMNL